MSENWWIYFIKRTTLSYFQIDDEALLPPTDLRISMTNSTNYYTVDLQWDHEDPDLVEEFRVMFTPSAIDESDISNASLSANLNYSVNYTVIITAVNFCGQSSPLVQRIYYCKQCMLTNYWRSEHNERSHSHVMKIEICDRFYILWYMQLHSWRR